MLFMHLLENLFIKWGSICSHENPRTIGQSIWHFVEPGMPLDLLHRDSLVGIRRQNTADQVSSLIGHMLRQFVIG